mmetsp:Transcript_901/g.1442  ORF Transcript_901/g.1442 Transcript_901/m.1442 type:complete len:108 (+) Transcript_901:277-600(+)|eukprot:CAMPEP_0203746474 /NCGR_PEP_ID=MMETSP0098-20131031/1916_1 /ASSEMBLY_ACC=CAM_ASM_000208 /TAXON_ID=96639 /ORGANISM=" , Strain NY0313808BC1" /LENGTH=107 /DNA_ID=CAMNT_0050634599 /DNA_START=96 /DNA_END=419 /DNA_ORIENTATION=+
MTRQFIIRFTKLVHLQHEKFVINARRFCSNSIAKQNEQGNLKKLIPETEKESISDALREKQEVLREKQEAITEMAREHWEDINFRFPALPTFERMIFARIEVLHAFP